MSRVKFLASGRTHDFHSKKEQIWWEDRIRERGLKYSIETDGRDTYINVDDRGDPFFEPKVKSP